MSQLALDGSFYHCGIANDPVVIVSVFDEGSFRDWCSANRIFTQILEHRDPKSGLDRPAIYISESIARTLAEGASVRITIDVRPESRGNGIAIVNVAQTS